MLVVTGSIQHESNTFCPARCTYEDFDRSYGVDTHSRVTPTEYFRGSGVEVHPTLYANSVPSGTVERQSFERLLDEMLNRFPKGGTIDGVWLYCHGAMEVEGVGSGDTAILAAVRHKVGPSVPIAAALDFHANNTEEIALYANIICGYRTAPHSDMAETQIRAARHLVESIHRAELPRIAMTRVPLIITGDMVITAAEPMKSIIDECVRLESVPGIASASVFNGQPWVDAENNSASAVVVAQSDAYYNLAMEHSLRLARMLWEARNKYRFQVDALEAGQAVRAAMTEKRSPLFISDSGDNTTAGALGFSANLLRQLVESRAENALVAGITCPSAVEACGGLSPGDKVAVRFGGEQDGPDGSIELDVTFIRRSRMAGWDGEDAGENVLLTVSGVDIIATARPCAVISPEIIESSGARLSDYKIIAVKLGYLYPKLAAVAAKAYLALTPGVSCEDIGRISFNRIRRPSWPLDKDMDWNPERKHF